MVIAAQRSFEAIERPMQIPQRLPARPPRIDALGPAIAILTRIPSVAATIITIITIVTIIEIIRLAPT